MAKIERPSEGVMARVTSISHHPHLMFHFDGIWVECKSDGLVLIHKKETTVVVRDLIISVSEWLLQENNND